MEPTYRCPDCGNELVLVRPESRPLRNRYGRTRPALYGCPNRKREGHPRPWLTGWFEWASETQPKQEARAALQSTRDDRATR